MFHLFPPPKSVRTGNRHLFPGSRPYIRISRPCSDLLVRAVHRFASTLPYSASVSWGCPDQDRVLLSIEAGHRNGNEGSYELTAGTNGCVLRSDSDAGIFHGLQTLGQVIHQCGEAIPLFTIRDAPDFPHRGVMLDVSRCKVPTLATLFHLIDLFASLKINQLQLYTEHTFEFVNHPLVWADASPLSAADMTEIRDYCADRFIELVPCMNSFGHFERWLRHPEYHRYAECPDGFVHPFSGRKVAFGSTLKPNRQSLQLLAELYDEYLPLFSSAHFNIGGDEPWELGQGWSRSRCEKSGSTQVYIDFLARIRKLVEKRGRRMMFWSDIVLHQPESLQRLSTDVTALNWGYEARHPFRKECEQMASRGIPFYVCPGTSSWNSITGRTDNMAANLANAGRNGLASGATGYLITDWGDGGHHQYLPISYPGFVTGACHAWNTSRSRRLDINDAVNRSVFNDPGGLSSELLLAMGSLASQVPSPVRNGTIFNRLLFWSMRHEPAETRSIRSEQLLACRESLLEIRSRIPYIDPRTGKALLERELQNAVDMAIHGIDRLLLFRSGPAAGSPDRPRKNFLSVPGLRSDLTRMIGVHEELWLERNRPGGLRESTGRLVKSLEAIS